MKHMRFMICIGVITSVLIMVLAGSLSAATVTIQREGPLPDGQERTVLKNDANTHGNQLKFAPGRSKSKVDVGMKSEAGDRPVGMERYKPYQEGEGESKIK